MRAGKWTVGVGKGEEQEEVQSRMAKATGFSPSKMRDQAVGRESRMCQYRPND